MLGQVAKRSGQGKETKVDIKTTTAGLTSNGNGNSGEGYRITIRPNDEERNG